MNKDWNDLVANPEALGEKEKELWLKLEPILSELIDELKKNGRIESVYLPTEIDGLRVIVQTLKNCSTNYNLLLHTSDNYKNFLQAIQPFGFDESLSVHLFIEVAIVGAVITCEMFRILLLFHSKGLKPDMTLGAVLTQLEARDGAPNAVAKLRPYVDLKLRNALAHGLVGTEGNKIVLYKNAKFDVLDRLDLADFMRRSKDQNLLTQCFITVINEKKRKGTFL